MSDYFYNLKRRFRLWQAKYRSWKYRLKVKRAERRLEREKHE